MPRRARWFARGHFLRRLFLRRGAGRAWRASYPLGPPPCGRHFCLPSCCPFTPDAPPLGRLNAPHRRLLSRRPLSSDRVRAELLECVPLPPSFFSGSPFAPDVPTLSCLDSGSRALLSGCLGTSSASALSCLDSGSRALLSGCLGTSSASALSCLNSGGRALLLGCLGASSAPALSCLNSGSRALLPRCLGRARQRRLSTCAVVAASCFVAAASALFLDCRRGLRRRHVGRFLLAPLERRLDFSSVASGVLRRLSFLRLRVPFVGDFSFFTGALAGKDIWCSERRSPAAGVWLFACSFLGQLISGQLISSIASWRPPPAWSFLQRRNPFLLFGAAPKLVGLFFWSVLGCLLSDSSASSFFSFSWFVASI